MFAPSLIPAKWIKDINHKGKELELSNNHENVKAKKQMKEK